MITASVLKGLNSHIIRTEIWGQSLKEGSEKKKHLSLFPPDTILP